MDNFVIKKKETGKLYYVLNYEEYSDNTHGMYLIVDLESMELSRIISLDLTENYTACRTEEAAAYTKSRLKNEI